MLEIVILDTIRILIVTLKIYLLELENIDITLFDKNRILIYSK